jgi:uncharacterized protein (TIGR00255 family)
VQQSVHKTEIASSRELLTVGRHGRETPGFSMQELNREANTLGSKAADITTTQVSMQLKLLIEQMREQIQNID